MFRPQPIWVLCASFALISLAVFAGSWLSRGMSLHDCLALWELIFKAVAGLIALSGATLAVIRYFDDRSKALETAYLEARKPFLTKQQQVYSDLLLATATVSTVEDYKETASIKAEQQFWVIFWGSLPLVTDEPVATLADRFAELLAPRSDDWVALRNTSMDLSRACRSALGFEAPLPAKSPVTARTDARPG